MGLFPTVSIPTIEMMMKFPDNGTSEEMVLETLSSRLDGDLSFSGESILGSMCTLPHEISSKVYHRYLDRNIGDPGLHPRLQKLEEDTVSMIGNLLGTSSAAGSLLTGGTEANIVALWGAKRTGGKRRKVVLPESSHFSFDKAADLMDLQLCKIPVDRQGRVKLDQYLAAVDDSTMVMVAVAGTTGLGAVDPVEEIAETALKRNIPLHVDAAFGGFVLPFLAPLGYPSPPFDFSLKGVHSITIDPHKMGRCAIPAGALLYRDKEAAKASETAVSYLSGGETRQRSIVGTRSGAAVASVWATVSHLGYSGYVKSVKECMERTFSLYNSLIAMKHCSPVIYPEMNVVGIRPSERLDMDNRELAGKLRERGWALSLFPDFLRITIMPHVTDAMIEAFLTDLQEISE
jgi:tyrosine decarboxylase / aspartate 1-decarboxylase